MFSAHTTLLLPCVEKLKTMDYDRSQSYGASDYNNIDTIDLVSQETGVQDHVRPHTMGPAIGNHMMNELQLRQIQAERQIVQAQEVCNVRNEMQMVKREVSDLKSMVLQIGLTKPFRPHQNEPQPVNVVVNTQNNVTQEVKQEARDGDGWTEFNKSLRVFFKSPFNRFCFFGTIGFGLYVYNQKLTHTWRMTEMQRRIDTNMFLRMAQWMNGRTYS